MQDAFEARVTRLEVKMDRVEEGVSNFRDFQKISREFYIRHDERGKQRRIYEEELAKELSIRSKMIDKWLRWLTWGLGIIIALITIYTFASPLIRKAVHLPVALKLDHGLSHHVYNQNPIDSGISNHP